MISGVPKRVQNLIPAKVFFFKKNYVAIWRQAEHIDSVLMKHELKVKYR